MEKHYEETTETTLEEQKALLIRAIEKMEDVNNVRLLYEIAVRLVK